MMTLRFSASISYGAHHSISPPRPPRVRDEPGHLVHDVDQARTLAPGEDERPAGVLGEDRAFHPDAPGLPDPAQLLIRGPQACEELPDALRRLGADLLPGA